MKGALKIKMTQSFIKDWDKLPVDIQSAVNRCIEDFDRDPLPQARRPHSVTSAGRFPKVFTLDVLPNRSYKLSFEIADGFAMLRRVGTHKQIDRWE